MTDQVKVTAADREAAALLAEWLTKAQVSWGGSESWLHPWFPADVREGAWDNHDWVQAFARHRIASQEQAVRAAIEAAARLVHGCIHPDGEPFASTLIRSLDPAQITKGLSDD